MNDWAVDKNMIDLYLNSRESTATNKFPEYKSYFEGVYVPDETATTATIDIQDIVKKEIDKVLDRYFKRMYQIVRDISNFSISEEEFMKLLKEG